MSEADLERLIADWYRRLGTGGDQVRPRPTADCPPLTLLWRHLAEGHSLGDHQDHVNECERCRRLCQIIEQGAAPTSAPSAAPVSSRPSVAPASSRWSVAPASSRWSVAPASSRWKARRIYLGTGLLAAAACLALLVVGWPPPSLDAEVGAFAERAYWMTSSVRGDEKGTPAAEVSQQPAWITAALADPGMHDALASHDRTDRMILCELGRGGLRIDPAGRLALADAVDEATPARRDRLANLLQENRAACEAIIDALLRHVPGATAKDRPRLERAFNRWRAEHVFGGG